jgi:UDP-glucose 4-epimerase
MKKILITGGCGYVGSRVALELARRKNPVIVCDIISPGRRGITFPPEVEYRQVDLRIPEDAEKALAGSEVVLHLAADIGSLNYMRDYQADIIKNNAAVDAAVYPALIANNVKWVVYASSSMVFQGAKSYPYTEGDLKNIPPPTNVYGFSKLVGEYFCRAFSAQYGISYTVIRYHNIYGPGEDSKGATPGDIHVIPALLEKVYKGQYPLEILGDPNATRPFTFVDDAVDATVRTILAAKNSDERIRNEDLNIGNDISLTIGKLGEKIWSLFGDGRPFKYVQVASNADTAVRREVDIRKIREVLNWKPKTPLEDGLRATWEWISTRQN